jgi:hypothetical protein
MSEQTLKGILGALGILVILWLGSVLLSGRRGAGSALDGRIASLLEGLDETTVDAVRIVGPNQTATLQRSGGVWTVNGNLADSSAVTRFWNALVEAEVGGVVANNPSNHERMGLSASSAWTVDFTLADGGMASVLVGKAGPIFPSGYVRLPDQDAVVVVSGDFQPTVILSVTQWRDKTILRVDTSAVARVVLETDEGIHVAERSDTTWSVDGEPANANTMRSVLDELANLVALGFVEDGEALEENPRRVIALGAEADTLGIVVITGESATRHARTPGSALVFEIPIFRADRIAPAIEALRAADAAGV